MKLKKLAAISMTGLMVMGMALPAAAEEAKTGDVNGDGKIVVGYISKNLVDPFHVPINDAAEELLQGMVDDGTIDEFTGILDGNTDGAKQCDLAQDCINMACDYVIILPAEAVASDPAVTSLVDAGTKVVVVNSKTDSTADLALTYCGSDDVYAGQLMAEYVMEQVPDGGVYVHLQGVIGNSAQIQRGEGIVNTLDSEKWELAADVPCDWAADKAVNAAQDYMAQYGDELKAIICENDDMAMGALQAAESQNRDLIIIGTDAIPDALQAVKDGRLSGTVLQDANSQASTAVDTAVKVASGEEVEERYDISFQLITIDNVDQYIEE